MHHGFAMMSNPEDGSEAGTQAALKRTARSEWKESWRVVLVSMVGIGMGGIHIYSLGAFVIPLSEAFDWPRAQITSGLTIVSLFSILCSAFVGMLIDRVGPRRVAIPGVIAFGLSVALLSTTGSSIWNWWLLWILVAASIQFAKATVWTTAIATRFTASRGFTIALALSGAGLSAALTPYLSSYLIGAFGWRLAYLMLALGWGLVTLPLALAFFRDRLPSAPDKDPLQARTPVAPAARLRETYLSVRFFGLGMAAFMSAIVSLALLVHFIPIMVDSGISKTSAAALAGALGISSAVGRLAIGWLFDRFPARIVGSLAFVVPALACALILIFSGSMIEAFLIACCIGVAIGAETDVAAYLTAKYFDLRNYGALFGMLMGILSGATGVGPLLAGLAFDNHGSYAVFLWAGIPASLVAAALIIALERMPGARGGRPASA